MILANISKHHQAGNWVQQQEAVIERTTFLAQELTTLLEKSQQLPHFILLVPSLINVLCLLVLDLVHMTLLVPQVKAISHQAILLEQKLQCQTIRPRSQALELMIKAPKS
jgi:hypothetical protein